MDVLPFETKEVNIDNFDATSDDINQPRFMRYTKKNFKVLLYLNEELDGGEMCDVIDLVPEKKDAQFFKIKMKISKKDRNIKSWTMFDKSGNKFKYSISKSLHPMWKLMIPCSPRLKKHPVLKKLIWGIDSI